MRRRTELYIVGHRVDLDEDAAVLLNYATADLYNPSVIRNSFSREIRLPGTQVNDDIFGSFFRVDRRLGQPSEPPARRRRATTISWEGAGDVTVTGTGQPLNLGSFVYAYDTPDESVTIDGTFRPSVNVITNNGAAYVLGRLVSGTHGYGTVLFVQAVGYDTLGNKVAASPSYVLRWWPSLSAAALQAFTGYTPDPLNTALTAVDDSAVAWNGVGDGPLYSEYMREDGLAISLTAVGLKRVDIIVTGYNFQTNNGNLSAYHEGETPSFYERGATIYTPAKSFAVNDVTPGGEPVPDPPGPEPEPEIIDDGTNYRTDFDPSARADFSLYTDGECLLMTGYAKLTDVVETGGVHEYAITLYGGLGSFIWNLSQRGDGQRMTLADLDYLGGGDAELDFTINASAVRDAWARLTGDTSKPAMWDVINFAPCYNGIPEGDFDADKALARPADVGLDVPTGLRPSPGGYTLIQLAERLDEWEARDLRSYLQRPVLSVRALLNAIANPDNNGGWAVDISDLTDNWPYLDTWLTRPLLPSLGTYKQITGTSAVTFDSTTVGQRVGAFNVSGVPAGMKTTVRMDFTPVLSVSSAKPRLYMYAAAAEPGYTWGIVTFIQPVAYDSGGNVVTYGDVVVLCPDTDIKAEDLAAYVHYTPQGGASLLPTRKDGDYTRLTIGIFRSDRAVTCEVDGADIASVRIMQTAYVVEWMNYTHVLVAYSGDGTDPCQRAWADPADVTSGVIATNATTLHGRGTATWASPSTLRSGAVITKRMLLSTDGTPADYLLALCKVFGLYIVTDTVRKSVAIMRRAAFYAPGASDVLDLTFRDDKSHEITMRSLTFDARWYDFRLDVVPGAFAKEYKETSGRDYGAQRLDTGYAFDADAKDVLGGVVLKGAAATVKSGRFMVKAPVSGGAVIPPAFIIPGNKYTLWDGTGDDSERDVPQYTGTVDPLRGLGPYDFYDKAEFREKDGKPVDGADVLLFYNGMGDTLRSFPLEITDDVPDMEAVNGKPCWLFSANTAPLRLPYFSRYEINIAGWVVRSLDLGVPGELDIPNVTYLSGTTIYAQAWRQYMHDRLDRDNKVLRLRVHLDGIQVGPDLLRRFWWWRGSLWVLSSIEYSVTSFDTAACEFVQVRDIANYITQY